MLGMLSPASRGALMTAALFLFVFMGYATRTSLILAPLLFHQTSFPGVVSGCAGFRQNQTFEIFTGQTPILSISQHCQGTEVWMCINSNSFLFTYAQSWGVILWAVHTPADTRKAADVRLID